jgi:hypothetical protein
MNPQSRSELVNCFSDITSISNFPKLMFLHCSGYHNKRKTDELINLQKRKKHASEEYSSGIGFSQNKQVCILLYFSILITELPYYFHLLCFQRFVHKTMTKIVFCVLLVFHTNLWKQESTSPSYLIILD